MRLAFIFFIFTQIASNAWSQEMLSDASYLRKLSFHLRGQKPTGQEYIELEQIRSASEKRDFFEIKIKEYLKSDQHKKRMVFRLSELFRVKTPAYDKDQFQSVDEYLSPEAKITLSPNSLSDLFERIARDNLSWDELLIGKSYMAYPKEYLNGFGELNDINFFKLVFPSLPNLGDGLAAGPYRVKGPEVATPMRIDFESSDSRIAGALTTERFLRRYTNTALNKNRRRAAAVFNIFLCDPMVPAISSDGSRKHEFIDATFAKDFEVTDDMVDQLASNGKVDLHGTDPQCMSCHSKLDPLGRTFQASGVVLHPNAFGGKLYYRRSSTETVNVSGSGIGDLAEAITKQPEYLDCQVTWFWNQFIGKDVLLNGERKSKLIQAFDQKSRRTNDFIEYLVKLPEFRQFPKEPDFVSFQKVKPLLKRCDSCHSEQGYIPSFSTIPFGYSGTDEEHLKWTFEVSKRIHLPQGAKGRMPKDRDANWSQEEIQLLKDWMNDGWRDENGQPTVTN